MVLLESTRRLKLTKLDYILVERWFSSSVKACSRYWPWPQLTGCKYLHQNEEKHMVPKQETKMGSGEVTCSWKILGEPECENKNVELQRNNIKTCVWDTVRDSMGTFIGVQESHVLCRKWSVRWMNEVEECQLWKRMNDYIRLMNKLKRVTDKTKKGQSYVMRSRNFKEQDVQIYVLQGEELGWNENHEIQNIATEESKGNITADKRQVLKIWENYVTELWGWPKQPKNLEVKTEVK